MNDAVSNLRPASLPFFPSAVQANRPGAGEEFETLGLDLRPFLIEHPAASFVMRAGSDAGRRAGVLRGDLLVIDRAAEVENGSLVVAYVRDRFVLRRFGFGWQNKDQVWGVITHRVRLLKGCPNITLL
jgi:DNA polymerase V